MEILTPFLPLILDKSGEIVLGILLGKFWEWLLCDAHLRQSARFFKLQVLVLYLDWVLHKTPIDPSQNLSPQPESPRSSQRVSDMK